MKLRTRARYSLRMMMAIAKLSSDGNTVRLGEISRKCGVSRRYLEQLVTPLRNSSLVISASGRGGGYALARDPKDIRINDIIKVAIGPIVVVDCAVDEDYCVHNDFCNCKGLWSLINLRITQILEKYSLADMIDENWLSNIKEEMLKEI